ncbi:MAG TPA: hypothetical protein VFX92_11130 [Candidatus Krumholzibacteria bacterium]|nr:hypothetical protein [Candidatus Krumholzibacteria bacterium]
MTTLRRLVYLARADFLERVRRYAFLVTMVVCVCLAYAFVPPNPSKYVTLKFGEYRGIYNSAWIGTSLALLCGTFLSVIGFYLVKNTIDTDRRTRVGQVLAATSMSKVQYTIGKTLSNFAVLAAMTLMVAVAAIGMQLLRAEDRSIDLVQLFLPFALLTLPTLMVTAALAVFFETIPGLRGGIGNVVFFFGWIGLLSAGFSAGDRLLAHNDLLGAGIAWPSMAETCARFFPAFDAAHPSTSMGINVRGEGLWTLETFPWNGIHWTPAMLGWRALWLLGGLALGAVASLPFDRFDSARAINPGRRTGRRFGGKQPRVSDAGAVVAATAAPAREVHLTPLAKDEHRARAGAMIVAEWKLITRGLRWWYAGPLAVLVVSLFLPVQHLRHPVLVLAFLWPVLLWSRLGTRERRHNTEGIFYSAPRPLSRQLPATWLAGIGVSLLMCAPIAVRLVIAGEGGALLALFVGAAFVPALAIALGVWTGSGKFFEAFYMFMWYAALQRVPSLDYMGSTAVGVAGGGAAGFAVATLLLLAFAAVGRHRRLQN